jgi:polar amino acid transport system substrate-binding protein
MLPAMPGRPVPLASAVVGAAVLGVTVLAGCAPADEADPGATATPGLSPLAGCGPRELATMEPGTFTVATDEPAFEPWVVDDDPANGQGFESAVAYAVAERLGFAAGEVTWVRVPFTVAIQPGPKPFDVDINQFSITDERRQAVDFSSPYYEVAQAVVTVASSPAAGAGSIADLRELRIGAQVGTTSLEAIEQVVDPANQTSVFNTNDDAKLALQNGQVDAIVVDLPTAFFITAAELDDGTIVGQLADPGGNPDSFGLLLEKDSPLTGCVSAAVDALRAAGTLEELEQEWLADVAEAPVLR